MFCPTSEGLWLAEAVRGDDGRVIDFLLTAHHGAGAMASAKLIGKRWTDVSPKADHVEFFSRCRTVAETGQTASFEAQNGSHIYRIHACITGGKLALSVFDITAAIQTGRDLRQNRDLLRIAGRMGRLGAWSLELPEYRVVWSEEIYRIHDVPKSFDPNLNQAVSFFTPECRIVIREAVRQCATEGSPYDLELEFITAKGKRLWVRTIGQAEIEDGSIKRLYGTFQDITAARQSAEALEENRQFLTLALSSAEMSISDWHIPSGRIFFDENWRRVLGYGEDEIQQTLEYWDSLIPPEDQPAIMEAQARYFEGRAPLFEVEYRMRAKDGSLHWVLERAKIVERAQDGSPVHLSGIILDITERKETEARLESSVEMEKELRRQAQAGERAKSEFLAAMSHEIRTPMNGVLGFADLLSQTQLDSLQRDYVHTIRRSGGALLQILDDILDYSRLEAGRLRFDNVPFSLRQILTNVSDLMNPAAHNKGLLLETKIAPNLPDRFEGAGDRLQQVLLNMVGNAIKFTAHGSVTLGVRRAGKDDHCEFFVRDTGIGITPDQIRNIFEPFMQADASLARRYGGTGLGLAISQRFVQMMGGKLLVESVPGAGSNFHFTIPLQEIQVIFPPSLPEAPFVADPSFAIRHPLSILVAEDDPINRKLMVRILRNLGYTSYVAGNGREAVDIFISHRPNCILMDLHMPEMDGIDATRRIRKMQSEGNPPYIAALTADVMPEERQHCFDVGMNGYLTKPIDLQLLTRTLEGAYAALKR
jgi:PAS domain S-box-containing protein